MTNERKPYYPPKQIMAEVRAALSAHPPGAIDWVTFVGSGEPLLHDGMGWMIRQVKKMTDLPVAVITNGSLLYLPEVRSDLSAADTVLPTLDAGTEALYRRINRPHPEITFTRLVDGLIAFRQQYHGKLWLEVMLVQGMNDTPAALQAIADVLRLVLPDAVHINLPTRPPAEVWVRSPSNDHLMQALAILGNVAEVVHPADGSFDLSGFENVIDAILSIITRHPMRQAELERALTRWSSDTVQQVLSDLETSGKAQVVERFGVRFWSAAPSYYPVEGESTAIPPVRKSN